MRGMNLFREMEALQREMNHLFDDFAPGRNAAGYLPGLGTRRFPRINVREDEENYYVDVLLPGVKADEIDMAMTGSTLTLSGERVDPVGDRNGKTWHRRERGFGKFLRTIELPHDIDTGKVQAEYRLGVLHVTLPKTEEAKPKKIAIKAH